MHPRAACRASVAQLTLCPPHARYNIHGKVDDSPAALAQLGRFLTTGEIYNACGGPCDF